MRTQPPPTDSPSFSGATVSRGGQLVATLEGHTDQLTSAAFSPDGQLVVTASNVAVLDDFRTWLIRTVA